MLKSILGNSSRSLCEFTPPEDVKMHRLALYTERGRCWDYLWDWKLFILFGLYEELFCLKDAIVEVCRRESYSPIINFGALFAVYPGSFWESVDIRLDLNP